MRTATSRTARKVNRQMIQGPPHFELLKAQLENLSPQQLVALRTEINSQLADDQQSMMLTDEEAVFINKLFI